MAKRETKHLRVLRQPLDFAHHTLCNRVIQAAEILIEFGGGLYSIHRSSFNSSKGRVWPCR